MSQDPSRLHNPGSPLRTVEVLLNTLEHERHAPRALLVALTGQLRAAMADRAPESTRALLARADQGEMGESEYRVLLKELRALVGAP